MAKRENRDARLGHSLGACFIQNATAAEIVLPKSFPPGPAAAGPEWYPTRYLQQGTFFELGARYWFSSGTYSEDLFGGSDVGLLSRLTYSGLIRIRPSGSGASSKWVLSEMEYRVREDCWRHAERRGF